jgi:predicted glycosyltransferase
MSSRNRRGDTASGPRVAIFTHDTFGLGHVRRCLHIAAELARRAPDAAILLVTGSPAMHVFRDRPANVDVVKIPTLARTGEPASRPPHLPVELSRVSAMREAIIRETLAGFAPDVVLVDNFPLGSRRELLPALRAMQQTRARLVLGLRDIVDAPEVVRESWDRQGVHDVLEHCYHRILVYGMREVFDSVDAYRLSEGVAGKLHYCGYVTDAGSGSPEAPARTEGPPPGLLGLEGPFLLATGGGGGDAFPVLETFLRTLPLLPAVPALVVTGPLMGAADRERLRALAAEVPQVVLREFVPDLPLWLRRAEVAVTMGGYNVSAEIVATGACAVIVPRTWRYGEHRNGTAAGAEWEQRLRAEALTARGFVKDWIDPAELTPERLAASILRARTAPPCGAAERLDISGAERVAGHLLELAAAAREMHA